MYLNYSSNCCLFYFLFIGLKSFSLIIRNYMQNDIRKFYKFRKNISFEDADKEIEMMVVPSNGEDFKITVMVDYNSPILGTQHARLDGLVDFESEIASCRTFVFMKEVAALAANGLIKGGDVDNSMDIAQEEIFGPVLSVIPYDDMDHAVQQF